MNYRRGKNTHVSVPDLSNVSSTLFGKLLFSVHVIDVLFLFLLLLLLLFWGAGEGGFHLCVIVIMTNL